MSASQIKKMRMLERYAKYIWPIHRMFVKKYLSDRCKHCLLTEKASPFTNGICAECQNTKKTLAGNKNKENILVEKFNSLMSVQNSVKKSTYDLLLLLSGGKDSAYLLKKITDDFPDLRVLTFTIDNGFFSPIAKQNIDQILRKIPVDHIVIKPNIELFRKTFQYALKNVSQNGCYEIVDRLDGDLLHDLALDYAARLKIPFVATGLSWAQVEDIFHIKDFEMPESVMKNKRQFSGKVYLDDVYKGVDRSYWWDPSKYSDQDIPRYIFPFYVWRMDEEEIKRKVLEWGLIEPKNLSPLVTNNATIPVMGIADVNIIGYSSFEPEFAKMIREGKADRTLWKNIFEINEYIGKTGWMLGKDVKETLSMLKLDPAEIGLRN